MAILNVTAGAHGNRSLKLRKDDNPQTLRERIATKLLLPTGAASEWDLKYEWIGVYYLLDDEEDWDMFQDRVKTLSANNQEINMEVSGQAIAPAGTPSYMLRPSTPLNGSANTNSVNKDSDGVSVRSSYTSRSSYSTLPPAVKPHSVHVIATSERGSSAGSGPKRVRSGAASSGKSGLSDVGSTYTVTMSKKGYAKSIATVETDWSMKSQAFEDFQNSRGVRTFVGSVGPVNNVRMMMKNGHRACYMSRDFAQQHGFIPTDAAPGRYGYGGLTSLGRWPITVGTKTVDQEVMLVEHAFFPIVLGRSFMEKRGVKTDPLDQTSITFMDTAEIVPTDVVVVKDVNGVAIPVS